jgi:hypothetical protein
MLRTRLRSELDIPLWALKFYTRHLPPILGLSLLVSAERFAAQMTELPAAAELFTMAVRALLLFVIVRAALFRDPEIDTSAPARHSVRRFLRTRWSTLAVQGLLLGLAAVVFDVIPEQVVGPSIPAEHQPLYTGLLLAVKNPTVIALTIIWLVGLVRAMMPRTAAGTPSAGPQHSCPPA